MQYIGDVSDSVLAKLSSYYNENAPFNTPYIIYRSGQNNYVLVYGSTDDYIHFSGATVVNYDGLSSGYNTYYALQVTEGVSYTVPDIDYTGYCYSSHREYIPSRYISNSRCNTLFLGGIFVAVLLFTMCTFISSMIASWRSRNE